METDSFAEKQELSLNVPGVWDGWPRACPLVDLAVPSLLSPSIAPGCDSLFPMPSSHPHLHTKGVELGSQENKTGPGSGAASEICQDVGPRRSVDGEKVRADVPLLPRT